MNLFSRINKLLTKELLQKIFIYFYIISIFLDFHIFYNSISTLIRIILITIIFLVYFFKFSSKKERKILLIYFLLDIIYIIFHIVNTLSFNIDFHINYSILSELLYFLKMSMNILIIYIVYKMNIKKETFFKVITVSSVIISSLVVIPNIFKFGYTSYDFNKITYNIFDWFTKDNLNFLETSSKGVFHLTNQISSILVLYFPILLLIFKSRKNIINIIAVVLCILSLFILGTKVSTYSIFIILILYIIFELTFSIINKKIDKKFLITIFLLIILSNIIYVRTPISNRNDYYEEIYKEVNNDITTITNDNNNSIVYEDSNLKSIINKDYINWKEILKNSNYNSNFYEYYYPITQDLEFYQNLYNEKGNQITTRDLERFIIERIVFLNNNNNDKLIGIGYNRIMNIFNIENDYIMQYYSLGIIGLILILGVNVLLIVFMYFKTLFNLKKYFNYLNIVLIFTSTYFLFCSCLTFNILNSISCIIPIAFILGFNMSLMNKKTKKEKEYYLGISVSTKSKQQLLNEMFLEKRQVIINNINPLIINNFYKNDDMVKFINSSKYNIPDGNGIVLLSHLTSECIRDSIPGIELMEEICRESIQKKYTLYFFGSTEDSLQKTIKNLKNKYAKINVVGCSNGYLNVYDVIKDIKLKKPDVLFVALGSPLQENFIYDNLQELQDIKIIMPVGGSFDVLSGNKKRAPKLYRKLRVEWFYRMIQEPKRFKQLLSIFKVCILVLLFNICYNKEENYEFDNVIGKKN